MVNDGRACYTERKKKGGIAMCGRYNIETEEDDQEMRAILDELNRRYMDASTSIAVKTGEIFPTDVAPVLLDDGNGVTPAAMRWGFPRPTGSGVIINARSETVREKFMFRQAIAHRRIAVPTSGFYEWRHEGGKTKEKYLFRPETDIKALYLAGIYSLFAIDDGVSEARFTILTTDANASMVDYHDRMPVLLASGETDVWIRDKGATDDILHRVPVPLKATAVGQQRQQQISLLD